MGLLNFNYKIEPNDTETTNNLYDLLLNGYIINSKTSEPKNLLALINDSNDIRITDEITINRFKFVPIITIQHEIGNNIYRSKREYKNKLINIIHEKNEDGESKYIFHSTVFKNVIDELENGRFSFLHDDGYNITEERFIIKALSENENTQTFSKYELFALIFHLSEILCKVFNKMNLSAPTNNLLDYVILEEAIQLLKNKINNEIISYEDYILSKFISVLNKLDPKDNTAHSKTEIIDADKLVFKNFYRELRESILRENFKEN